jgi:hypothetical protein
MERLSMFFVDHSYRPPPSTMATAPLELVTMEDGSRNVVPMGAAGPPGIGNEG